MGMLKVLKGKSKSSKSVYSNVSSSNSYDITKKQYKDIKKRACPWKFTVVESSTTNSYMTRDVLVYSFIQNNGIQQLKFQNKSGQKISSQTQLPFYYSKPYNISNEFYYYEIKVVKNKNSKIHFGLGISSYRFTELPGTIPNSVCYHSSGLIYAAGSVVAYAKVVNEGDVVGIGYYPSNGNIFFTLNGDFIQTLSGSVLNKQRFYPFLGSDGECILEVNFGVNHFVYKPDDSNKFLTTEELNNRNIKNNNINERFDEDLNQGLFNDSYSTLPRETLPSSGSSRMNDPSSTDATNNASYIENVNKKTNENVDFFESIDNTNSNLVSNQKNSSSTLFTPFSDSNSLKFNSLPSSSSTLFNNNTSFGLNNQSSLFTIKEDDDTFNQLGPLSSTNTITNSTLVPFSSTNTSTSNAMVPFSSTNTSTSNAMVPFSSTNNRNSMVNTQNPSNPFLMYNNNTSYGSTNNNYNGLMNNNLSFNPNNPFNNMMNNNTTSNNSNFMSNTTNTSFDNLFNSTNNSTNSFNTFSTFNSGNNTLSNTSNIFGSSTNILNNNSNSSNNNNNSNTFNSNPFSNSISNLNSNSTTTIGSNGFTNSSSNTLFNSSSSFNNSLLPNSSLSTSWIPSTSSIATSQSSFNTLATTSLSSPTLTITRTMSCKDESKNTSLTKFGTNNETKHLSINNILSSTSSLKFNNTVTSTFSSSSNKPFNMDTNQTSPVLSNMSSLSSPINSPFGSSFNSVSIPGSPNHFSANSINNDLPNSNGNANIIANTSLDSNFSFNNTTLPYGNAYNSSDNNGTQQGTLQTNLFNMNSLINASNAISDELNGGKNQSSLLTPSTPKYLSTSTSLVKSPYSNPFSTPLNNDSPVSISNPFATPSNEIKSLPLGTSPLQSSNLAFHEPIVSNNTIATHLTGSSWDNTLNNSILKTTTATTSMITPNITGVQSIHSSSNPFEGIQ